MASLLEPITQQAEAGRRTLPAIGYCAEKQRLVNAFLHAVREMNAIEEQQVQALIDGDGDFPRFDILLHFAQEKKDLAKYLWIAHAERHGCTEE